MLAVEAQWTDDGLPNSGHRDCLLDGPGCVVKFRSYGFRVGVEAVLLIPTPGTLCTLRQKPASFWILLRV